MIEAITQGVKISVKPIFLGIQNRNKQEHFFFEYYIVIENISTDTIQLFSRHWEIYDSLSQTEIVEGEGVIGIQPVLESGQKHAYKSNCILLSNCGSMKGYYTMLNLTTKNTFNVEIPKFQLQTESILN